MKIAGRKHDLLWCELVKIISPIFFAKFTLFRSNISDQQAAHLHVTAQERADLIEEVLTEVSVYLGMLYHLIEVFKGHDDFADELSQWYSSISVSDWGAEMQIYP